MAMDIEQFKNEIMAELLMRMNQQGACDASANNPNAACKNVLWSSVSTEKFYRSCRTDIDVVETGTVPIAPGQSVTLSQGSHPGWMGGCFMLTYRLANDGKNHGDIKIEWFLDDEPLDTAMYGSEIYDNNNGMIGDGKHPLPMHCGQQCCIGGLNKLKVKISHTGTANQLEAPRVFVTHGKPACCNGCAAGQSCQAGCKSATHGNGQALGNNSNVVYVLPQGAQLPAGMMQLVNK